MKWWQRDIPHLLRVLIGFAVLVWVSQYTSVPAANYLTLSVAHEVQAGHGSIFPTLDPRAASYPLAPFLLSMTQSIVGDAFAIFLLVGGTAFLAAYFLGRITDRNWTGVAFLFAALMAASLPECVMLCFAFAGVLAAKQGRWWSAGLLIGMAITAHPAAIILAALVAIWGWQTAPQHIGKYVLPVLVISGLLMWLMTTSQYSLISVGTPVAFFLLMILSAIYLFWNRTLIRENPLNAVLLAWSVVQLAALIVMPSMLTIAIVPGLLALASLRGVTRNIGFVVLVLDVLLYPSIVGVRGTPTTETLSWLSDNTTAQTTIATSELGAKGYALNRPLIDLSNLLAPPSEHRTLSDPTFFVRYAPDVVVITGDPQQVAWSNFPTTYANTFTSNGYGVYQRVVNFTVLDPHPVEVVFNGNITQRHDLTLTEVGIADQVHPGDLVRVRLTWALTYTPSFEMQMRVMLVDATGKTVATANDKFAPEFWQSGETTTYHLLPLPADLADGALTLRVGIGIRDGDLGEHEIVTLQASKPQ